MNANFLRDEAARFRGMADDTDREATRERLLAMAADYDARAEVANDGGEPNDDEAVAMTAPAGDRPREGPVEPNLGGTLRVSPGRRTSMAMKETVTVDRRPVGRPRRE